MTIDTQHPLAADYLKRLRRAARKLPHEIEAVALAVAQQRQHAELEHPAPQLRDRRIRQYHAAQGSGAACASARG